MKNTCVKVLGAIGMVVFALQIQAQGERSSKAEPDLAFTSLEELGFGSGYTFEGLQSDHQSIFHFPVPREIVSGDGKLIIEYTASPGLDGRSMLRVDVNGAPVAARRLDPEASSGRVEIVLAQKELERFPYLNVMVKASLLVEGDRCTNDRLQANYLHLMPQSGLQIALRRSADSLRGAWEALPKRVRISLSADLSESAYRNVLYLARHLMQEGKRVELLHLPELGELVIAGLQDLEKALHQRYLATEALREQYGIDPIALPAGRDAYLLQLPDRQIAVFSEPFENLPSELFAEPWRQLTLGSQYAADVPAHEGRMQEDEGRLAIPLDRLGLDSTARHVGRASDWYLQLSPYHLAGNLRPETLHLDMVSSPSDTDTPLMLQVFMNGILQQVSTLPNDGEHHQFGIHFSEHDYKPGHNEIHLRVQRNLISGDCMSEPPAYPVQLSSESYLVVNKEVDRPREFNDLHALFADGLDLYVPEPDGASELAQLAFLANLISNNDYPLENAGLYFLAKGQAFKPSRPFILLGQADHSPDEAGVSFDRGVIRVTNKSGKILLDVDRLPRVTVSQLVKAGDQHGLWILAREGEPMPVLREMVLENDSVAFSDERGLLLTLNPAQREVSLIEYPQHQTWFDHLGRYRFWLLALGWLLLTLLVVQLYAKVRKHRQVGTGE